MAKENKIEELPWYIEAYAKQVDRPATDFCDEEAVEFYRDFVPLYAKYSGTKSLMKHLRNYINTHEFKRKDDFRFQLVSMWCFHIQYYRERNGIPFKPEDVFKIRIPKEILSIR